MADTTHLQLPLLAAAQAQKHVTHNDAVLRLDALVQLAVKDRDLTAPPGSPADGDRYIPASGSTGAWEDWDLNVAWFSDGVWTKLVPRAGWLAYVEDEDILLVHDGSSWEILPVAVGTWQVLAASAVAVSHTGDTNETTLATVTVPAGAMGTNGVLRVTMLWSHTSSAGTKSLRTYLGGLAGALVFQRQNQTTTATYDEQRVIANRGAENSQVTRAIFASFGATGQPPATSAVDTSQAQDLVFAGELADGSDTITLESYLVEVFHQA